MALVPHKITALAESDAQGTDGKNIVAGAVVSLYDTNGTAVTLFDDANGANGSTAKQTDATGQVVVYVTAGEYDEEVNGSIKRRVSIGGNSVTSYPTTTSLESSRPSKTGQRAENQERGNAQYTLAPSGYTAGYLDISAANNRVWKFDFTNTIKFSNAGAVTDSDSSAIAASLSGLSGLGYVDLEGKTWDCSGLDTDNAIDREMLNSVKFINGKLVVTNSLNGETNVQTFAPFLESEVQLSETKSPIVDWTGLNVLWLGTSIPHQAVGVDGYPERLAEKLNFTVQNWAWSGSHAFYDIDGDAFNNGTIRALSMTEADRLAGLATYGASSAYDDSFDIVTKASQMTTEYRIKRQFESGAIDCVVLDHNHNDRKNIAGYEANDKTINAVVKGTSTTFTLSDVGGLFEGDGCYVRVVGIDELDYAAGRITGISGNQVTVAIDSSGMAGSFTSGEFKFVDRNTVDGAFDFLIAYTKNMFIRYGSADGKIILCGAPSYFTNDVNRDHAIWSVNRSIKAIADRWDLAFFDVANALRLTYRDHVTYLPDDVHPSTPETRKVFANVWAKWMNGGAVNFYNPEEVLQRNKTIESVNNQPALYSKYDESFATRDVIYTEDDALIDDDFSSGLGAWTQLGTGTPAVVSAPWGSGDAVQFDVLADNTAPYIRQDAAVGAAPVLEFDFYMPSVDVATGITQQVTIASINAAGGAGYSLGIIQTVGGATQLRATYNKGGYGAAPVVPLPGATLKITDATKYRVKIDVVDGYIFFSVDGVKLYAGAIDNSLLGAASSILVGPTFTNMSSAFSLFIGNVVAGAKSEQHVMTTEELQKTVQSYTLAELQSMNPTLTGRRAICSDRADAPLELAPSGYTAQAGDIVAANGRVWELQIDTNGMSVSRFGGDYDTAIALAVSRCKGVCDIVVDSEYTTNGVSFASVSDVSIKFNELGKLLLADSADSNVILFTECTNIKITAPEVDGNRLNQTVTSGSSALDAIKFESCNEVSITGGSVVNAAGSGIRGRNCSNMDVDYVNVTGSGYRQIYIAPSTVDGSDCENVSVTNCIASWEDIASSAITNQPVISLTNNGSNAFVNVNVSNCTVTQHPDDVTDSICIELAGIEKMTCSENICTNGDLGISWFNCSDFSVGENPVKCSGSIGIECANRNINGTISGNTIDGEGTLVAGVAVNGGLGICEDITINSNQMKGVVSGIKGFGQSLATRHEDITMNGNSIECVGGGRPIEMQWVDGFTVQGGTLDGAGASSAIVQIFECDNFAVIGTKQREMQTFAVNIASGVAVTVNHFFVGANDFDAVPGNQQLNYVRNSLFTGSTIIDGTVRGNSKGPDYIDYANNVIEWHGAGSPEGVISAGVSSGFRRTDGGAGTCYYRKESGTGNTGWVAK